VKESRREGKREVREKGMKELSKKGRGARREIKKVGAMEEK
jgi:hypothetical protein